MKVRTRMSTFMVILFAVFGVALLAMPFHVDMPGFLRPIIGLVGAGVVFLAFFMRHIEVEVDALTVRVGWGGIYSRTIPRASILSAKAVAYEAARFGGWGWKGSFDGATAFSLPGYREAVEIRYRLGETEQTLVVTVEDAAALAAAMQPPCGGTPT